MSYGMTSWTCGECGETYSSGGAVGDLRVDRWRMEHKEEHRLAAMSEEERIAYVQREIKVRLGLLGDE